MGAEKFLRLCSLLQKHMERRLEQDGLLSAHNGGLSISISVGLSFNHASPDRSRKPAVIGVFDGSVAFPQGHPSFHSFVEHCLDLCLQGYLILLSGSAA